MGKSKFISFICGPVNLLDYAGTRRVSCEKSNNLKSVQGKL